MPENLINQLLAEEKEEGLGKKFPEAFETSSVRGPGLHRGSHSGQFVQLPWEARGQEAQSLLACSLAWAKSVACYNPLTS